MPKPFRTLFPPAGDLRVPRSLGGTATLATAVLVSLVVMNRYPVAGSDFSVYYVGGLSVLDGGDIYAMREDIVPLPFTYPSFAAVLFAPLGALDLSDAGFYWTVATIAAICYVVAEGVALLGLSGLRRDLVFGVTALAAFQLEPVHATLRFGQINAFILALVVADVCGRLRLLPRGLLIGVACGVKLTPLIFVVHLALTRRLRAAATAVVTFVGTIALSFLVVPSASWRYWTELVRESDRIAIGGHSYVSNQSIDGVIARRVGDLAGDTGLWLLVAGVVGLIGLGVAVMISRRGHELLGVSTCGITALLVSPISWTHHYVWVVPAAIALVALLVGRLGALGWAAATAVLTPWLALFVMGPVWWVPRWPPQEFAWSVQQQVVGNSYVIAALAWLVAVAVIALPRGRDPHRRAPGAHAARRAPETEHEAEAASAADADTGPLPIRTGV